MQKPPNSSIQKPQQKQPQHEKGHSLSQQTKRKQKFLEQLNLIKQKRLIIQNEKFPHQSVKVQHASVLTNNSKVGDDTIMNQQQNQKIVSKGQQAIQVKKTLTPSVSHGQQSNIESLQEGQMKIPKKTLSPLAIKQQKSQKAQNMIIGQHEQQKIQKPQQYVQTFKRQNPNKDQLSLQNALHNKKEQNQHERLIRKKIKTQHQQQSLERALTNLINSNPNDPAIIDLKRQQKQKYPQLIVPQINDKSNNYDEGIPNIVNLNNSNSNNNNASANQCPIECELIELSSDSEKIQFTSSLSLLQHQQQKAIQFTTKPQLQQAEITKTQHKHSHKHNHEPILVQKTQQRGEQKQNQENKIKIGSSQHKTKNQHSCNSSMAMGEQLANNNKDKRCQQQHSEPQRLLMSSNVKEQPFIDHNHNNKQSLSKAFLYPQSKYPYVIIDTRTISELQIQHRRMKQSKQYSLLCASQSQKNSNSHKKIKEFLVNHCKVSLKENYIKICKRSDMAITKEAILSKQGFLQQKINSYQSKQPEQLFVYNFWLYKGNAKSFRKQIVEQGQFLLQYGHIKSDKLFPIKKLYRFYSMVHYEMFCSDFLIVVEKRPIACTKQQSQRYKIAINRVKMLIKGSFQFVCTACQERYAKDYESCLCLKYGRCHKINEQKCHKKSAQQTKHHLSMCKYSFSNKKMQQSMRQCYDIDEQYSGRGLMGIINEMNDCFMNTALQCLAATKPLTEYFMQKAHLKHLNLQNHLGTMGQVTQAYAEFLKDIYCENKSPLQIYNFKNTIVKWNNKYREQDQQDSQEFLIQLLDWLKQDLNTVYEKPKYITEQEQKRKFIEQNSNYIVDLSQLAKRYWLKYLLRNNSIIEYFMAGLMRSTLQCSTCLYQSHNFEVFLTLPLTIPKPYEIREFSLGVFQLECTIIHENFRKKNQKKKISLKSESYDELVMILSRQLNEEQQEMQSKILIGYVSKKKPQQPKKIQTSIEGSNYIRQLKQSNKIISHYNKNDDRSQPINSNSRNYSLYFMIYDKEIVMHNKCEITFIMQQKISQKSKQSKTEDISKISQEIKINSQNQNQLQYKYVTVSIPRLMYFLHENKATMENIVEYILKYCYSCMYKRKKKMSLNEYLQYFMSKDHCPFNVYVKSIEKKVEDNYVEVKYEQLVTFKNKAELYIRFNQDSSSTKEAQFDLSKLKKVSPTTTNSSSASSLKSDKSCSRSIQEESTSAMLHPITVIQNPQQKKSSPPKHCYIQQEFSSSSTPELASNQNNLTIYDCFEKFRQSDHLSLNDNWTCPKCQTIRQANKTMSIYQTPKILIIFFKRLGIGMHGTQFYENYNGGYTINPDPYAMKNDSFIEYPLLLNMQHYVQNFDLPQKNIQKEREKSSRNKNEDNIEQNNDKQKKKFKNKIQYKLFAVTNHFAYRAGQETGGHYVANIKHELPFSKNSTPLSSSLSSSSQIREQELLKQRNWFLINDEMIRHIEASQVCNKNAYMLFYERV